MARKLRLEYPGAIYHVLNRGDHRERIFKDDHDREVFLATLTEACAKTGWQIHAYCLMGNHFHAVIETPQANLVAGMKWLLGTYTSRFNHRHKIPGHLFSGRYKTLIMDGSGTGYLKTVCDYVHLNPVRAKLLAPNDSLSAYRWSSLPHYLRPAPDRPPWLQVIRLLGEHGIPADTPAGRREFGRRLERRRTEIAGADFKPVERGWYLGNETFRQELLAQMKERLAEHNFGAERHASATEAAEAITQAHLNRLGWTEADLAARAKGDPEKLKLAFRLRSETTVTIKWIAARLHMGTWTYLNHLLYWERRRKMG